MNQPMNTHADGLVGTTAVVRERAADLAAPSPPHWQLPAPRSSVLPAPLHYSMRFAANSAPPSSRWSPTRPTRRRPGRIIGKTARKRWCFAPGPPRRSARCRIRAGETFSANWNVDVAQAFHWTRQALRHPLAPGSTVIAMSSGAALGGITAQRRLREKRRRSDSLPITPPANRTWPEWGSASCPCCRD